MDDFKNEYDDSNNVIVEINKNVEDTLYDEDKVSIEDDEMVVTKENPDNHQLELLTTEQFKLMKEEGSKLFFELKTTPSEAGLHKMGFRVYPVNKELPHRMDFAFVRWIQL